jgi:hypothetical protein
MLFIAATTFTAAHILFYGFLIKASEDPVQALDAGLVALMAALALVVLLDSAYKWYGFLKSGAVSEAVEGLAMPAAED